MKCGAYEIICTVFWNDRLRTSLIMMARAMGNGNPTIRAYRLMPSVLRISSQKLGNDRKPFEVFELYRRAAD